MKNLGRITAFMAMAIATVLTTSATAQTAGVRDTVHNLSGRFAGDNDEVCVYCHTPHGANTAAAAPLWNKVIPTGLTFQTYDSSTMDAQLAPSGAGAPNGIGSVSIACLTCHEGTQGMDVVINAPGSGRFNSTVGTDMDPGTDGTMNAIFGPDNIRVIGSDLRNDHPISIEYAGFTRAGATGKIDPDFATPTQQTGQNRWWVDTTVTGSTPNRDKTDMVLYTRTATGGAAEPFVECASCHDPHSTNPTFLRISNQTSAVCLACHVK